MTASALWKGIKKTLQDGVNVAAEITEEYTRIGKLKLEVINLQRMLEKTYKALGREVYVRVSDGKSVNVNKDESIVYFIDKINEINGSIKKKEKEIEVVKEEGRVARKENADNSQKTSKAASVKTAAPAKKAPPKSAQQAPKKPAAKKAAPAGKTSPGKKTTPVKKAGAGKGGAKKKAG